MPRTALFVDNDDDDVLFNIDYYFLISIINKNFEFFYSKMGLPLFGDIICKCCCVFWGDSCLLRGDCITKVFLYVSKTKDVIK